MLSDCLGWYSVSGCLPRLFSQTAWCIVFLTDSRASVLAWSTPAQTPWSPSLTIPFRRSSHYCVSQLEVQFNFRSRRSVRSTVLSVMKHIQARDGSRNRSAFRETELFSGYNDLYVDLFVSVWFVQHVPVSGLYSKEQFIIGIYYIVYMET